MVWTSCSIFLRLRSLSALERLKDWMKWMKWTLRRQVLNSNNLYLRPNSFLNLMKSTMERWIKTMKEKRTEQKTHFEREQEQIPEKTNTKSVEKREKYDKFEDWLRDQKVSFKEGKMYLDGCYVPPHLENYVMKPFYKSPREQKLEQSWLKLKRRKELKKLNEKKKDKKFKGPKYAKDPSGNGLTRRQLRFSKSIVRALNDIVLDEKIDRDGLFRYSGLKFTDSIITVDLGLVTVFWACQSSVDAIEHALEAKNGTIRFNLCKNVLFRRAPVIEFKREDHSDDVQKMKIYERALQAEFDSDEPISDEEELQSQYRKTLKL